MNFKIESLRDQKKRITTPIRQKAITYDGIKIQSNPTPDRLENDVIRTLERMEHLDIQIKDMEIRLEKRRSEALETVIKMKEGQSRRFLMNYYIECKSLNEITKEYRFQNKRTIYSLKKRAIKKFEKFYKRG